MKRMMGMAGLLLVVLLAGAGCGRRYADAKRVYAAEARLVEAYVEELDRADDAQAVARAINRYADGMEELAPRIRSMQEKYPELRDPNATPRELQEAADRREASEARMTATMLKVLRYMDNEDVLQAQQRLGRVLMQAHE